MNQAFVKENDSGSLLHQIKPTIPTLVKYIRTENQDKPVFVKQINKIMGIDVIDMSNGLSYFINNDNNWEMCL